MKRILAVALLSLSAAAHAEVTLMGTAANASGGMLYLFKNVDECNTNVGVLLKIPFNEGIPGCVTSSGPTSMHVYFKNGMELDYDYTIWTPVAAKKSTKGAL
jgi:hypothetical protein